MKFDIRTQFEAPQQRIDLLPFGGERGLDHQSAVTAGELLVDLTVHHVGHGFILGMGVHGLRVALRGPAQGLRLGWRGHTAGQNGQRGHQFSGNGHVGSNSVAIGRLILAIYSESRSTASVGCGDRFFQTGVLR